MRWRGLYDGVPGEEVLLASVDRALRGGIELEIGGTFEAPKPRLKLIKTLTNPTKILTNPARKLFNGIFKKN